MPHNILIKIKHCTYIRKIAQTLGTDISKQCFQGDSLNSAVSSTFWHRWVLCSPLSVLQEVNTKIKADKIRELEGNTNIGITVTYN